jgi:hypothetical protein
MGNHIIIRPAEVGLRKRELDTFTTADHMALNVRGGWGAIRNVLSEVRIRIRTKMSRIPNTAFLPFTERNNK